MLPCRCAGVLIVAFGCVCGSVNNSTALGKTVLHSFLSACWLVIPFIVGLSLGVSVCRCVCVCVCVCVCLLVVVMSVGWACWWCCCFLLMLIINLLLVNVSIFCSCPMCDVQGFVESKCNYRINFGSQCAWPGCRVVSFVSVSASWFHPASSQLRLAASTQGPPNQKKVVCHGWRERLFLQSRYNKDFDGDSCVSGFQIKD